MSRTHLLWIAPWIAFGLGACATLQRPAASKACAEWRWIAIKTQAEGPCPPVPGWKPDHLFTLPEADYKDEEDYREQPAMNAVRSGVAARELQRFCVYQADETLGRLPFAPPPGSGLEQFNPDCAAVSRAAESIETPRWEDYWQQLRDHAGRPDPPLVIKNRMGVRLAFLDTHPDDDDFLDGLPPDLEPTSEHGSTLAHIARDLVCSDQCAAKITTRLALPIVEFDPESESRTPIDLVKGGNIGFQSHLAQAIVSEVDDWQRDLRERPDEPDHLVLNISAAWDGRLFDGLGRRQIEELRAGTQAVYQALQYAAEHDVLVLAAAGNKKKCRFSTRGPLLPAAWEEGTPPEGMEIRKAPKAPLLYAVGGVDSRGRPLGNARPRGMPRRAAYGENAVVPALTPGESTNMYTGTSVATAVASSIAAVVWDTMPGVSPARVMDVLDNSETALPLHANFWFGSSAAPRGDRPPVHRLSLCTALKKACLEREAVNCPLPLSPEATECPVPTPVTTASPSPSRSCHPWMTPQPEEDPCPPCNPPRG